MLKKKYKKQNIINFINKYSLILIIQHNHLSTKKVKDALKKWHASAEPYVIAHWENCASRNYLGDLGSLDRGDLALLDLQSDRVKLDPLSNFAKRDFFNRLRNGSEAPVSAQSPIPKFKTDLLTINTSTLKSLKNKKQNRVDPPDRVGSWLEKLKPGAIASVCSERLREAQSPTYIQSSSNCALMEPRLHTNVNCSNRSRVVRSPKKLLVRDLTNSLYMQVNSRLREAQSPKNYASLDPRSLQMDQLRAESAQFPTSNNLLPIIRNHNNTDVVELKHLITGPTILVGVDQTFSSYDFCCLRQPNECRSIPQRLNNYLFFLKLFGSLTEFLCTGQLSHWDTETSRQGSIPPSEILSTNKNSWCEATINRLLSEFKKQNINPITRVLKRGNSVSDWNQKLNQTIARSAIPHDRAFSESNEGIAREARDPSIDWLDPTDDYTSIYRKFAGNSFNSNRSLFFNPIVDVDVSQQNNILNKGKQPYSSVFVVAGLACTNVFKNPMATGRSHKQSNGGSRPARSNEYFVLQSNDLDIIRNLLFTGQLNQKTSLYVQNLKLLTLTSTNFLVCLVNAQIQLLIGIEFRILNLQRN